MSQNQRIIVQNLIYKTTTNQPIFEDLNLTLTDVKTGLVGKNGIGKSTLLKLIAKELEPNSGAIKVLGEVGYCPQDFTPYHNLTLAQFFGIDKKMQALENISQGSCDPEDFTILADNWNIKERVILNAEKFAFKIDNLNTKTGSLSNGEITRLWLAKIFYQEPQVNFLILDEPTNNLDIIARNILYNSVKAWSKGMLVISHDQELLELMDQTLALTEHGTKIYGGNFSFYQEQQSIEHAAKEQQVNDAQKLLRKTTTSIQSSFEKHERSQSKGKQARKKNDQPKIMLNAFKNNSERTQQTLNIRATRLIASAEKELKKAKESLEADYCIKVTLPKTFVPQDKIVAVLENVTFHYTPNQPPLLHNFNLTIRGPEHLAICGANGSGKTTLLKLIQKVMVPESGTIRTGVTTHYLDQRLEILEQDLSILDNYKKLNPKVTENEVHKHLASFLFRNETALKKVASLSCGEKIRAALACILLAEKPPELLMLDEPTNHLDLENMACLESILKNFEGALIIISHDKKFLEKLKIDKTIFAPFS